MLKPVDEVCGHGCKVIREPERGCLGIGERIENLRIVVKAGEPRGQARAQHVQVNVRVGANVGLPVAGQDHVLASAKLGAREHHLRRLEQQQRHGLLCALAARHRRQAVEEIAGVPGDPVGQRPPFFGRLARSKVGGGCPAASKAQTPAARRRSGESDI